MIGGSSITPLLLMLRRYAESSLFSSFFKRSLSKDRANTPSKKELLDTFKDLQRCLGDVAPPKASETILIADVFIAFDEAHLLTKIWNDKSGLSNFTILRRALSTISEASLFTFFLSATGEVSQFMPPRNHDPSDRIIHGPYKTPRTFIALGFDHLMLKGKVLEKYKTLEQVTSLECISHMGRPM
jgi:hypothetical protein